MLNLSPIHYVLLQEMRQAIVSLILTNSRIADQAKLHTTDLQLIQLIEMNENVTPKLLADITGITTGGITVALDRLEKADLIVRKPHSTDRRRIIVALGSKKALDNIQAAYGTITKDTFEVMAQYTEEELVIITDFLSKIKKIR